MNRNGFSNCKEFISAVTLHVTYPTVVQTDPLLLHIFTLSTISISVIIACLTRLVARIADR